MFVVCVFWDVYASFSWTTVVRFLQYANLDYSLRARMKKNCAWDSWPHHAIRFIGSARFPANLVAQGSRGNANVHKSAQAPPTNVLTSFVSVRTTLWYKLPFISLIVFANASMASHARSLKVPRTRSHNVPGPNPVFEPGGFQEHLPQVQNSFRELYRRFVMFGCCMLL